MNKIFNTLGLDWDTKNIKTIKERLKFCKEILGDTEIEIYETKNGLHVIFPEIETNIELRKILFDDEDRIKISIERKKSKMYEGRYMDMLSDIKNKHKRKRRKDLENYFKEVR